MPFVRTISLIFICLQFFSCKEEITSAGAIITASPSKQVYQEGEDILIYIHNNFNKNIFLQKCGRELYPLIETLEGGSGSSFIAVCRVLLSFELNSSEFTIDTLKLQPGRYRLKYFYDYENIDPGSFNEILTTNEFKIE